MHLLIRDSFPSRSCAFLSGGLGFHGNGVPKDAWTVCAALVYTHACSSHAHHTDARRHLWPVPDHLQVTHHLSIVGCVRATVFRRATTHVCSLSFRMMLLSRVVVCALVCVLAVRCGAVAEVGKRFTLIGRIEAPSAVQDSTAFFAQTSVLLNSGQHVVCLDWIDECIFSFVLI
jgi:hypothetical protein